MKRRFTALAQLSSTRGATLLLLGLAVFSAWWFGPLHERAWHGEAIGRIPPGREAIVERWITDLEELGFEVKSAQIQEESIRFLSVFSKGPQAGEEIAFQLVRPGASPEAKISPSFGFRIDGPGLRGDVRSRVRELLAEVLARHDDGDFFRAHPSDRFRVNDTRKRMFLEPQIRFVLEAFTWFLLFALIFMLPGLMSRCRRAAPQELVFFAGVTAIAILLRTVLPDPGPIHANGHGLHDLSSFSSASLGDGDGWTDGTYGVAGAVMFRFVALLTASGGTELLCWIAVLLGLLTPVITLSIRALGGSSWAGRVGAAMYALAPILVRVSPTETPLLLSALLAIGAGCVAVQILRDERWNSALSICAIGMMCLAVQCHVVTIVWLLPWCLIVVWADPSRRARAWGMVLSVVTLCVPHVLHVVGTYGMDNDRDLDPATRVVEQFGQPGLALFNPYVIPFGCALLGLMALVRLRGRVLALFWIVAGLSLPLSVSVTQTLSDVLRYQAPIMVVFLIMTSLTLDSLVREGTDARDRRLRAWIFMALLGLTFVPTMGLYVVPDPETTVATIVEDAAEDGLLDHGLRVPRVAAEQKISGFGAPSWALPWVAPRRPTSDAPVLLGSRCLTWSQEQERPTESVHPTCARWVGARPEAIRDAGALPESYGGLPLWFHPRRRGAPSLGIYRSISPRPEK